MQNGPEGFIPEDAKAVNEQAEAVDINKVVDEGKISAEEATLIPKKGKKRTPSDFFKTDPNTEHLLYKTGGKEPVDVTLSHPNGPGSVFPNYDKIRKLFLGGGKKKYTEIHNHPSAVEDFNLDGSIREPVGIWDHYKKLVPGLSTLPSVGDLLCFLRDDSVGSIAVYQHNRETNETEGMYVVRKTKNTVKSGIEYSKYAEGAQSPDEAENSLVLAEEDGKVHDSFSYGPEWEALNKFNTETKRLGLKDHDTRQKLFDELIKRLNLQVKYLPSPGYHYSIGQGFIKGN